SVGSPVCRSISIIEMWQPNGYVLLAGSQNASSLKPGSSPSGSGTGTYAYAATLANDLPDAGDPFTEIMPFSNTRSFSSASSSAAANFAILVFTLVPARCSAVPATACDRL